jgi:vancomycin resistance protein YoaR
LIQVPKVLLAYEQFTYYSIYASVRDTTTYGECRKQNYDVALAALDGVTLVPGEQLNMNTLIANDPDYCEGTLGKYLFYQGVCGGSTQLFWNALVNPYLYVVERHPHGEFWTNFYGYKGEDAAIYERSKELILENIGNEPLHFATFVRPDGNTVLLSIYPKKEGLRSFVQKQET